MSDVHFCHYTELFLVVCCCWSSYCLLAVGSFFQYSKGKTQNRLTFSNRYSDFLLLFGVLVCCRLKGFDSSGLLNFGGIDAARCAIVGNFYFSSFTSARRWKPADKRGPQKGRHFLLTSPSSHLLLGFLVSNHRVTENGAVIYLVPSQSADYRTIYSTKIAAQIADLIDVQSVSTDSVNNRLLTSTILPLFGTPGEIF